MSVPATTGAGAGRLTGPAARLWEQLGTNRRAAGGVIVIAALLAFYGVFVLDDIIDAQRAAYRQQISETRRSLAISADKDWPARAKTSTNFRNALEKEMWQFDTEGVALANLQDWINAAGRDAGLGKLQAKIDVARPKGLGANIFQFTATITASQTEEPLQKFLAKIERDPHLFVVRSMHVQVRPYLLEMTLVTYAKISGSQGAAAK